MSAAVLQMQSWRSELLTPPRPHKKVKTSSGALSSLSPRYQEWAKDCFHDRLEVPADKVRKALKPRLPPRSRFGCWTCRTRKVKCDEQKPTCTPCSRLGHFCDYSPRLSFKDDTPRVIEKMAGSAGAPGPVWNPRRTKRRRLNPQIDFLPAFNTLTNDEDRERKAEFRPPGTYHVVVNEASFADYEEYRDRVCDDQSYLNTPVSAVSRTSMHSDYFANDPLQFQEVFTSQSAPDPNIVILKVFEDDSKKLHSPASIRGRSSRTSTLSVPIAIVTSNLGRRRSPSYSYVESPLMQLAHPDGRDNELIYHYQKYVKRYFVQVHRDTLGMPVETGALSASDAFERQAVTFRPLYHALMAYTALSMSQRNGTTNFNVAALQHYQQALPSLQNSLRTDSDLASDGIFLMHFVLLLYEVASGEPRSLSLWQHHITQLQRIVILRRELYGSEPYSFVVWWVANIDIYVLLSGMGNGEFVETMLQRNLLPSGLGPDDFHQPTSSLPASTPLNVHDIQALPSALAFHRRICTLAAELGLLARDLREEERANPNDRRPATISRRQGRVRALQETLRRTWRVQMPAAVVGGYANQLVPVGARGIFEHSLALHRALLIYSHTSLLPPSQQQQQSTHHDLHHATTEILHLAREIIASAHFERGFIVFPLFMAGLVAGDERQRGEVLGLLGRLEEGGGGGGAMGHLSGGGGGMGMGMGMGGGGKSVVAAAREVLEIVYGLRTEGVAGGKEVNWMRVVSQIGGLQVVNCRL